MQQPRLIKQQKEPQRAQQPTMEFSPQVAMWRDLRGLIVVIEMRGGATITGIVSSYQQGLIKLRDVTIESRGKVIKADWILIDRSGVGYIYPARR